MAHIEIYKTFKDLFPFCVERVTEWFPNGRNCIRLRLDETNGDYVFTYNDKREWRFETVENFIKNTLNK